LLRHPLARIAFVLLLIWSGVTAAESISLVDDGRLLYRTGIRADGTGIRAIVQGDVALPDGAGACASCHRRSGLGVSEGGSRSLNLTAPALFNPTGKPPLRPAYTDSTLVRAVVAGIDADERILARTMPRYELNMADGAALVAYLRTLGAMAPEGVSTHDISIATVIAAAAPEADRLAVRRVLERFVEIKNSGSRREAERASAADLHAYGLSRQRAHRHWNLQVWELTGPESTWYEQLETYRKADAPFAIVSGAAGSGWPVIATFCENREIPCLLPLTELTPEGKPGFYSIYFSQGVELQAIVTARHIANLELPDNSKIMVVQDDDATGRAAFTALNSELRRLGHSDATRAIPGGSETRSARSWRKMMAEQQPDMLLLWTADTTATNLLKALAKSKRLPSLIYTAEAFSDWITSPSPDLAPRIRHVYPYSLPETGRAQFPREHAWLKSQGFSDLDEVTAAKVLFACTVLGAGLAEIESNFSREYLIETWEHSLDGAALTSLYPKTSLGSDQRFLAKGAYVVSLSGDIAMPFMNEQWIQR
jgi:mono/diheme cytochrome c family protein